MHPYLHAGGDSFQKLSAVRTNGASNHRTIIQRYGLWSADQNGIWFFDGQTSIRTTNRIDGLFKAMSAAGKVKFHGAWDESFNSYVLFYQRSGSTKTDAAIMVDTFGARPRADRVGLFKLEVLKCLGSGMVTDSDGVPQIWLGDTAGHSYLMFKPNVFTFDAAAYDAFFTTKFFQVDPHEIYRVREAIITVKSAVATGLSLSYSIDFGMESGSANIVLVNVGISVTWTLTKGGATVTWTITSGGATVTWSSTTGSVTDAEAEIEGEGKAIQFRVSNANAGDDFAVSKLGMRAQRKRKVA